MRQQDSITTMQTAMLIHMALVESAKGQGDLLPLQATRSFFQEILMIPRWQTYHTDLLRQLVANGWLVEHVASHGTIFYSLSPAGRNTAQQTIDYACRNTFAFIPQSRTLFDIQDEN